MDGRRSEALFGSERSRDLAQDLPAAQLGRIHEQGKLPLLPTDMDDTLLPFGNVISEGELDLLIAYVDAGGQLVFNTLAPREWFYLRVVDRLANTFYQKKCTHCYAGYIGSFPEAGRSSFTILRTTAIGESTRPRRGARPRGCCI